MISIDQKVAEKLNKEQVETNHLKAKAESIGHGPRYEDMGDLNDRYKCACGWESGTYHDDTKKPFQEWMAHAKEILDSGQTSRKP